MELMIIIIGWKIVWCFKFFDQNYSLEWFINVYLKYILIDKLVLNSRLFEVGL